MDGLGWAEAQNHARAQTDSLDLTTSQSGKGGAQSGSQNSQQRLTSRRNIDGGAASVAKSLPDLEFFSVCDLSRGDSPIESSIMVTLSATVWIRHILACIGRCFGCYSKPTTIIAVDKPTKGLRIQGQVVKQPTLSDGFWSSSTFDLDHSSLQYQRSYSSISTSALNLGSALDSLTSVPEFVNHGLNLWNESRLQWIGSGRSETCTKQKRARALSWNSTYESVLSRKTPFSRPVPLSEMIEFLVEAWDQDGLYD